DYADWIEYHVIVKPAHASLAIGVRTNLNDRAALTGGLEYDHGELGYTDIIVERHATSFDTRAYVIEDRLIAAFKRMAANIEGDGEHTIGQLIDLKNQKRRLNPHLSASQIKIDGKLNDFIGSQGYSLDSVLDRKSGV